MAARTSAITARQIIGLWCPDDAEWRLLRTLQYGGLVRHNLLRPVVLGFACLAMMGVMYGTVPIMVLLCWAATLMLAWMHKARLERLLLRQGLRKISRGQFRHHAMIIGLCAVIWVAPLFIFRSYLDRSTALAVWTLLAMLIAGATASRTSIPMATVLFITITGGGAGLSFLLAGDLIVGLASLGFSIITTVATLESARLFLAARTAEAGVAESQEVVSLLLREYEQDEADWLWRVDVHRRVCEPSDRFAYALGCQPADIDQLPLMQVIGRRSWETGKLSPSLQELAAHIGQEQAFSNLLVQAELGSGDRWWKLSGTPMHDSKGSFTGYRGVGSDVTEQRETEERIAYQAQFDALTGLPNRRMVIEALSAALAEAGRWHGNCAFLMIDLDRFKAVNDTLGHPIGDRLLIDVAERLRAAVAGSGQCGRLGGDEFAAVVYDVQEPRQVSVIANRIIKELCRPFLVEGHMVMIGASIGSAIGPADGETVDALMRNADMALYGMKRAGRGGHRIFEMALQQDRNDRQEMEIALRDALPHNQLDLRYQPMVAAAGDVVIGFEALLRWRHPERGSISPDVFVALAEETRLILQIGEWAMIRACREAVGWASDMKICVNVSGVQLRDPGFGNMVARVLAETGLPPQRLEIEIKEQVFQTDPRMVRQALDDALLLGCSLALDDFGTGHSSLGNLRTGNFSTVKIDRRFVQGAVRGSAESLAVIRAVVAMSQSLGIRTVAEGVETADEMRLMRSLGLDAIQGFYFGRPIDAAETLALIDSRRDGFPGQGSVRAKVA
ncbi:EAL domain-containing protein [Altererythrobacter xixiisoli]|uniref:EAL domain-containing protein n=1 Tax=Croceibacterium xixiisoli TaxID=1476466 RepID=A0A6I4TUJ7_9SPHN|nr:EAL domain-containing protein [Croceibacterium xixiisoli]MXO98487.1 EAL domain-containing protein [Croceibacterium xixiisoli]